MVFLLDLDGVLITTPAWRPVPVLADGFFCFNEQATANLSQLLSETKARLVLTTSHRINYSLAQWAQFLAARGLHPAGIAKVNAASTLAEMSRRDTEIITWVQHQEKLENYVVIDDDLSLHNLPAAIKQRCVFTKPLLGLDAEATQRVRAVLGY